MPWVHSLAWEVLWLQSALWLVPLALLLAYRHADPARSPLDILYFGLTALFWIGHRIGSTWLAYATTAYRPLLRADPVRFVIVPLAITAACFATLLPGDEALPFTRAERVVALVILDYALVTYHFAAQHFGVLTLYRIRAGRPHLWLHCAAVARIALGARAAALGFATGFLHYWLDRAVYRLSDPAVRIAARGLLEANVPEPGKKIRWSLLDHARRAPARIGE